MTDVSKVKFQFSKSSEYRLVAATGVWGGPMPAGQIRIEFFVDHAAIPAAVTYAITPEGKVGEEVEREPSDRTIARELQMGVVLTPDTAESLVQWLQDKLRLIKRPDEKAAEKT